MSSGLAPGASEVITRRAELDLFSFAGPPDRRLTEASEAFSILLGLTPGEINGRALLEFVQADDVTTVSEGLADLQLGFPETLLECRFVQRDQHAVYLPWIARGSPGAELWRTASTDTADLIELLTERRDLRTRLDLAIGQATAAMWELNLLEDRFTWEPQAAEILGVSPETIPRDASALGAAVHPADSDAVHNALTQLLDARATEVGLRIGQDASLRYLSLRGRILDRDSGGRPMRRRGPANGEGPGDRLRELPRRARFPARRDYLRARAERVRAVLQPIISLADGDVTGFEALMRWNRPGRGLVAPGVFIPVAETSTLVCDLDRWALEEAAGQLAAWRRDGLDDSGAWRVAVNVSARHASTPAIVADVETALAAAGIAPAELELELNETALTRDVVAGPHLAAVRALGVAIAIDDFGTGDTSIAELARLPVDALKIDPQFTGSLTPGTQTLVTLMIKAGATKPASLCPRPGLASRDWGALRPRGGDLTVVSSSGTRTSNTFATAGGSALCRMRMRETG
jgi:EAL domain-containing protein (putative c-di-GMP-specific phosphodiesterase class I)